MMINSDNSTLLTFIEIIKFEASEKYLIKKYFDYRICTTAILLLLIPLGFAEGLFDHITTPELKSELLGLRLYLFFLIIPSILIFKAKSVKIATATIIVTVIYISFLSIKMAEILGEEAIYTVTTVAIYPFLIFFILIGLSIYIQITVLFSAFLFVIHYNLDAATNMDLQNIYFQIAFLYSLAALLVMLIFSWSYYHRYCLELALEKGSRTDPLTGVANRRHFDSLLKSEVNRNSRFGSACALIILDIDFFKHINDTYGHPTGDSVICSLANFCVTLSRETDLVARLGGEEFAIILPDTNIISAKNLAERIRLHVENQSLISETGEKVIWTISLGISALQEQKITKHNNEFIAEQLIQHADTALYEAKKGGRNRTVLYDSE
ncbi:GGDEF domain-containing protein [Shewanella algae]|uniref:GGDEF domain-containing protein n=1 Tax=Shewanella algae TaxID=38313 RepID=UPI0031F57B14